MICTWAEPKTCLEISFAPASSAVNGLQEKNLKTGKAARTDNAHVRFEKRLSGSGAAGSRDVSVDTEELCERLPGVTSIGAHHVFRRALGHNLSTLLSAFRP